MLPVTSSFSDFVYRTGREDLWTVDGGTLSRVDVADATGRRVRLPFRADHLNWLPQADLLVLGDAEAPLLHLYDPDTAPRHPDDLARGPSRAAGAGSGRR